MTAEQRARTQAFLDLHHSDDILVLPNAWDVASARVFAASGARAVGTTSMGIAAVHGYPDMEQISLDQMLAAVAAIAAAVDVPVTADMEAGYGGSTEAIVASVRRAIDCGIAGINIEDSVDDPDEPLIPTASMAERVSALRQAANTIGLPLVINARTDVFLAAVGEPETRLAHAIERGNAYRKAGADCVFVPGGLSRDTIRELAAAIDAPLNVVANPAISVPVVPTVAELDELGVARVSVGSGMMRASLAYTRRAAEELLASGSYEAMKQELSDPQAAAAYAMAIGRTSR